MIVVNNESKGYGRKWSGLDLRLFPSNLLERARKIHETLQYIWCPGRDTNQAPPECKS